MLQAGIFTPCSKRRSRRSRIFRAPQCGFSRLATTIAASICSGSWLAYRTGRRVRSLTPPDHLLRSARRSCSRSFSKYKTPGKARPCSRIFESNHKSHSFVHHRTLLPGHPLPPFQGKKCNPCLRNVLLPMSRNGQINQVRLKTVGMLETPYRGFAQPVSGSHCTRAPVRGIEGLLLRCFANHFSRASFVNGARSTGSRRILLKCLDATVQVAIAPARSLLWLISETYPSGRTVAALVDGAGRTSQVYNLADSKLYTETRAIGRAVLCGTPTSVTMNPKRGP